MKNKRYFRLDLYHIFFFKFKALRKKYLENIEKNTKQIFGQKGKKRHFSLI